MALALVWLLWGTYCIWHYNGKSLTERLWKGRLTALSWYLIRSPMKTVGLFRGHSPPWLKCLPQIPTSGRFHHLSALLHWTPSFQTWTLRRHAQTTSKPQPTPQCGTMKYACACVSPTSCLQKHFKRLLIYKLKIPILLALWVFVCLLTVSGCVAQADLGLSSLLPQPPKCLV
jgi:hypothetical protein